MKTTQALLAVAVSVAALPRAPQRPGDAPARQVAKPALWGELIAGAHAVGFRSDSVRRPDGGIVRIDTWYPAIAATSAMRFGDYLRISDDIRGATPGFPTAPGSVGRTLAATITGDTAGIPPALLDSLLDAGMAAQVGAPEVPSRFPLVLWTPRYATTVAQSVISEFLASHGFVVAFARPPAADMRLPFELPTPEAKRAELNQRVRDMEAATAALARRGNVDASAIGVVAWSYTGEMATHFQRSNSRVALVAGLSTTLLNDWVYQDSLTLASDRAPLASAYAVLTQTGATPVRPPAMLSRARTSYFLEFPAASHGSFNTLEGYVPSLRGITRVQRWSRSSPEGARSYEAVATILLRLLRHHVVNRSRTPLDREPLLADVPEGIVRR